MTITHAAGYSDKFIRCFHGIKIVLNLSATLNLRRTSVTVSFVCWTLRWRYERVSEWFTDVPVQIGQWKVISKEESLSRLCRRLFRNGILPVSASLICRVPSFSILVYHKTRDCVHIHVVCNRTTRMWTNLKLLLVKIILYCVCSTYIYMYIYILLAQVFPFYTSLSISLSFSLSRVWDEISCLSNNYFRWNCF